MKLYSVATILALVLALSQPVLAQVDHSASGAIGAVADAAGGEFVQGAKQIAKPFIVVGKTAVAGVAFVILKGEQGIVWVAEEAIEGAKYLVEGAKFVIIKTAKGVKWVAVQALIAGEIIFTMVIDVAVLVIEGVEYALIKLEDGVAFVAKKTVELTIKAAQAAKAAVVLTIKGVKYVLAKTAEGIVWVTEKTFNLLKQGLAFAREKFIIADIRTTLSTELMAGSATAYLPYFERIAQDEKNSAKLRNLAQSAYNACKAFSEAYRPSTAQK